VFRASVKGFEKFSELNADIDELCVAALNEAAEIAGQVATDAASIPLELEVQPAAGDVNGFSSGIRSRKQGKEGVLIATFFDSGTLAGRTRKLKRPRRDHWTVTRGGSAFSAERHPIVEGEGIPAEQFFSKARSAGRRALLARIDRGADAVRSFGR